MGTRRWVRIAAVTTLAVAGTLAVTAAPAQALPRSCATLMDWIDYDWNEVNEFSNWASIDQHDGNWQDYQENMEMAKFWTEVAQADTAAAQRAHCY